MIDNASLPDLPDYFEIKNNFLKELQAASKSQQSSLLYVRNILPSNPVVTNGIIQAVVIGGTYFEFATVEIKDGQQPQILSTKKGILPQLHTATDVEKLFKENFDSEVQAVGVNLAFPLDPIQGIKDELDGKIIQPTKEHMVEGLIGRPMGAFLREKVYKKDIPISVANDTVCLVLAGGGHEQVGLILGTGINIGLKVIENGKKSVVNLEAGNFSGFTKSKILQKIDSHSEHSGTYLFEKMIGGKYLVHHYNETIKELNLNIPFVESSEELSRLAPESKTQARYLAKYILAMSASLISAAIAGAYEFMKLPQLDIITEGSLFWKGWEYQKNVQKELNTLGIPEGAITFKKVDNSSLKGAIGLLTS